MSKVTFDHRGETRRPDSGPKHRDLFSPYCKFCGDPIEWAEFRYDEETKVLPVTPHTFEQHQPICRKFNYKPRRVFTNPNAGSSYSALQNLENERLKLKINELEATNDLNEKRIRELTNRLDEQATLNSKDDVGSAELRDAIGTMGQMSVHVRDLAKSVQLILKNGGVQLPKSMQEPQAVAPAPAASQPAPKPAEPKPESPATVTDLQAQRKAELDATKEKLFSFIDGGATIAVAAAHLGVNIMVAGNWVEEAKKSGRLKGITIDNVKLEKSKGGRYDGDTKRAILRDVIAGLSRPEIHQKWGCTAGTLVAIVEEAKKAGLEIKIVRKYVKRTADVKQAVLADLAAGKSVHAIAKERGIPPVTIDLWSGRKQQPKILNGHAAAA